MPSRHPRPTAAAWDTPAAPTTEESAAEG